MARWGPSSQIPAFFKLNRVFSGAAADRQAGRLAGRSDRGVAQLVARLVWDQEVAGSNPAAPIRRVVIAPVAQWIEHLPSKQRVAGSIPAGRSSCVFQGPLAQW